MSARERIAQRAAREVPAGSVINLGIGVPTLVPEFLPSGHCSVQSENGILGITHAETVADADPDIVNAGKQPVAVEPGASYFDSAQSFAMIRGGHIGVSIIGALQIDERGRIANWSIPGKAILGIGGAMDLMEGAGKIVVTILHSTRDGAAKILPSLQYPRTSARPVDVIITEKAVFRVDDEGLVLTEVMPGSSLADIAAHTAAAYRVDLSSGARA